MVTTGKAMALRPSRLSDAQPGSDQSMTPLSPESASPTQCHVSSAGTERLPGCYATTLSTQVGGELCSMQDIKYPSTTSLLHGNVNVGTEQAEPESQGRAITDIVARHGREKEQMRSAEAKKQNGTASELPSCGVCLRGLLEASPRVSRFRASASRRRANSDFGFTVPGQQLMT